MDMQQETKCRICQKAKSDFDLINQRINHAGTIVEKVSRARGLLQKVEAVREEHENADGGVAQVCLTILNLRKKAAELILKFEK